MLFRPKNGRLNFSPTKNWSEKPLFAKKWSAEFFPDQQMVGETTFRQTMVGWIFSDQTVVGETTFHHFSTKQWSADTPFRPKICRRIRNSADPFFPENWFSRPFFGRKHVQPVFVGPLKIQPAAVWQKFPDLGLEVVRWSQWPADEIQARPRLWHKVTHINHLPSSTPRSWPIELR